jgi:transmembrane sensor
MKPKQEVKETSKSSLKLKSSYFKAALVIAIIITLGMLFIKRSAKFIPVENARSSEHEFASITLSSGEKVVLNDEKSGVILDGSQFIYNDGSIINRNKTKQFFFDKPFSEILLEKQAFAVIMSPAKRMYRVALPDSTKVWLRANSSLKIPSDYNQSDKRIIQLTGEAYFDVPIKIASSTEMKNVPFVVLTNNQKIETFGTKFNVSAYSNANHVKTTLLEGKLRLSPLVNKLWLSVDQVVVDPFESVSAGQPIMLKPNQQANLIDSKFYIETVVAEEIVAWKDDEFVFRNTSLEKIMDVISGWHNIKVVYKTERSKHILLGGEIFKNQSLSTVLKGLSLAVKVNFKMVGNKIIVYGL